MKKTTARWLSGLFLLLFFGMIFLVKNVDVAPSGETQMPIGLSHLNIAFHNFTGVHPSVYDVTELLGFFAIACGGVFALVGFFQLIRRKNLWKVDTNILVFGVLCILLGVIYFCFEKIVINYRPIFLPGSTEAEASFPSSHTLLTIAIFGGLAMLIRDYIEDEKLLKSLRGFLVALAVFAPLGRLICGAHWLTDVLASVLLSAALLMAYWGFSV